MSTRQKRMMLLTILAATLCFGTVVGAELPETKALKIDKAPKLDGKLDEPFWKKAGTNSDFYIHKSEKKTQSTEFKMAYDNTWLYIGFDCKNPELFAIRPKTKGHDKGACFDDSVEIFLDPGNEGKLYFHYMFSWGGAKDERRIRYSFSGPDKELEWDVPWRAAANVRKDGWSAEIAIPLYLIASYGDFGKIRLNLCRNKRIPVIDACNVVVSEERESSSWSPVIGTFHEPKRFGSLTPLKDIKLNVPPLVAFDNAKVNSYYNKDGKNFYDVELDLVGYNIKSSKALLSVLDKPAAGKESKTEKEVFVQGNERKSVKMPVPINSLSEREINIELKDSKTGEVLHFFEVEDLSALKVMTSYLNRNYYTTEENAVIICELALPKETLSGMKLIAKNKAGKVVGETDKLSKKIKVKIPLKNISIGNTPVDLALRKKGALFYSVKLDIVKRKPEPGNEWKIDKESRIVLRNNKPFFPFGITLGGLGKKIEDLPKHFKIIEDANFNFIMYWPRYVEFDDLKKVFALTEKHNLLMMLGLDNTCSKRPGINFNPRLPNLTKEQRDEIMWESYEKNLPRLIKGIALAKKQKCLWSYFIFDEPIFNSYPLGTDLYNKINQHDGYHPVLVNYSSWIPEGKEYTSWMDLLATDPYWVPGGKKRRNTPNYVSKIVYYTEKRALESGLRQPTVFIPQAFHWSGCRKRGITEQEQKVQTYLTLIHGGAGILYFAYSTSQVMMDTFRELGEQMKVLGPICLSRPGQTIKYKSAVIINESSEPEHEQVFFRPEKEQFPDIQVCLKKNPAGGYVLLAANSRSYPVNASYKIKGLSGKAGRLFDDFKCNVSDESFSDRLKGYGIRAYTLKSLSAQPKFGIEVLMTHLAGDVKPEEKGYYYCRQAGKNKFQNPSFEDASVFGWPDYYIHYARPNCNPADPDSDWRLDTKEVKFGKRSMRLTTTKRDKWASLLCKCAPQHDQPKQYVFSAWIKGSKDGLRVWMRANKLNPEKRWGENKTFKVTTEWQRYHITGILPKAVSQPGSVFEIRLKNNGTIWVDGLQLEEGSKPTDFQDIILR